MASKRRGLDPEDQDANTLSGFAGAYGGLFSSTVLDGMMIIEVARPGGVKLTKTLVGAIVPSSISFAIYFAIAGTFFLDAYKVPPFEYEDWQLLGGRLRPAGGRDRDAHVVIKVAMGRFVDRGHVAKRRASGGGDRSRICRRMTRLQWWVLRRLVKWCATCRFGQGC